MKSCLNGCKESLHDDFKMQCRYVLFEPWSGGGAKSSHTFCAFGAVRWSAGETRGGAQVEQASSRCGGWRITSPVRDLWGWLSGHLNPALDADQEEATNSSVTRSIGGRGKSLSSGDTFSRCSCKPAQLEEIVKARGRGRLITAQFASPFLRLLFPSFFFFSFCWDLC